MIATVAVGMTIILFGLGMASCTAGLWIILSREYQEAMRQLSVQSTRKLSKTQKNIQNTSTWVNSLKQWVFF